MNVGIKGVLGLLVSFSLSILLVGCNEYPSASAANASSTQTPVATTGIQPSDDTTKPPPSESPFSTEDPYHWTDTILKSDLIVLGTITDFRYDVATYSNGGQYVYTIFTLSVEKVIKGDPTTKQLYIKCRGGRLPDAIQVPVGPYFDVTDRILIGLHQEENDIYRPIDEYRYPGTFWMGSVNFTLKDVMHLPHHAMGNIDERIGRIIVLMKANNIPVALPHSEWPPLPVGPIKRPENETLSVPEPPKNSLLKLPKTPTFLPLGYYLA